MGKKSCMSILTFLVALVLFVPAQAVILQQAVQNPHRTPAFVERDRYRNPTETLAFFELENDMTVVEILPGGGGWYTEILAPFLRENGKLYAAQFNPEAEREYFRNARKAYMDKLAANPGIYDRVEVTVFDPAAGISIAPDSSADRVLTFRNVHSWYRSGGEENVQAAFAAIYDVLKPGGILGVVAHRLADDLPADMYHDSGYLHQLYVIDMAEQAGLKLLDSSEINANKKDSSNHPHGVWTLPPALRLGDEKREHYLAIGESDRMTLKFIKPE